MRGEQPADDEAYQAQMDNWAETMAATANDLISDPLDAAAVLMQAAMLVSLKAIGLREFAEAQLASAQDIFAVIMGSDSQCLH